MQTDGTPNIVRTRSSLQPTSSVEQPLLNEMFREVESPVFEDSVGFEERGREIVTVRAEGEKVADPTVQAAHRCQESAAEAIEEKTQELYCFDCKKRFFSLGNSSEESPACRLALNYRCSLWK